MLTAITSEGRVWLKAPGPATVFEVRLYSVLSELVPERVLAPIAIDTDRGWLPLPDGGTTLRESGPDPTTGMLAALPRYGELQRKLAAHVDSLLATGVADMRAEATAERFDQAVAAVRRRPHDTGAVAAIIARRAEVAERADRLARAYVAPSLDHNDLHPGNVFVAGGRTVFYDWGDSVVAHPFASMLVAVRVMRDSYGADDRTVTRLRDSYLEAFSDLAPHRELVEQLDTACWVAHVARTLVWERALGTMDDPGDWAAAPLHTLSGLIADNWLKV
ncbi:aminoglycoside phosphotransferase family protein [Kibdelosporangium phytohabitans]|uniref:Aminoglycoside phosphotransferase domain-containing protein n=1 Tax=Kibdelosporangium phytohabitans TaxID=860235 RepID=A0A0N9I6M9_9PSEU|nr:aminoglycoside phosphotransferase family protein [Kibdelosporangium phytohabitans]ALG11348.1 hypothetical protein AOZ06_34760 [Kibdelosporangium phytohabitans]MBE1462665.1 hypothetical protein [Kibdelosporangium phytohabitans]